MSEVNPLEPCPFIATTKEQILAASKSKYCPVPANLALRKILESKNNDRFAVVGLPCHIHGIRKAEIVNKALREKVVLHIGIVCEGGTFNFLGTEYRLKTMGITKRDVRKIDYRGKGWPGDVPIYQLSNRKLSDLGWHANYNSEEALKIAVEVLLETTESKYGISFKAEPGKYLLRQDY